MTKINYQALREKAEKATWGDWDSYKPHRGARGYNVRLSGQAIAQHVLKNNAEFIAAFNPKVALALLDERERNQQYIKRRDQENEDIALTVSCSERMPEIRQTVIGWNGYAVRQCVYTRNEYAKTQKGREPRFETLTGIWHGVTHWMPLPEPPQEVK
ncbi:ead/Ea22-like family protein [Escherichia coli]